MTSLSKSGYQCYIGREVILKLFESFFNSLLSPPGSSSPAGMRISGFATTLEAEELAPVSHARLVDADRNGPARAPPT